MLAANDDSEIAEEDILRCPELDGCTLRIVPNGTAVLGGVMITDGERTAIYVPIQSGFGELLDTATLRIVRDNTEAASFAEANIITVTDGVRSAQYVPLNEVA